MTIPGRPHRGLAHLADCLLQVLTGILTFIVLHLENKVGYLRDGVKTLARAIHWQQAIDNYPVNDFGEPLSCLLCQPRALCSPPGPAYGLQHLL